MDKPEVQEEILAKFPFLPDDPKWGGQVEVVKRHLTFADGNKKTFTDFRLHVGQRWLVLPRRGIDDIQDALAGAQDFLTETRSGSYTTQPVQHNYNPPPQDFPPRKKVFETDQRNGRKNKHQEYDDEL